MENFEPRAVIGSADYYGPQAGNQRSRSSLPGVDQKALDRTKSLFAQINLAAANAPDASDDEREEHLGIAQILASESVTIESAVFVHRGVRYAFIAIPSRA